MSILALIAAENSAVSYQVVIAVGAAIGVPLSGAIGMLWRRIDRDNQKCLEERAELLKRASDENAKWFDRIEALHKERAVENEKMLGQIVKLAEKSEESGYATITALNDCSKSMIHVERSLTALNEKTAEIFREALRALHDRRP